MPKQAAFPRDEKAEDAASTCSGCSLGSPRRSSLRPAWADIEESDDPKDVLSSPWFSAEAIAESQDNTRKRKVKIVNKKLVPYGGSYAVSAGLELLAQADPEESGEPGPAGATATVPAGASPPPGDHRAGLTGSEPAALGPQAAGPASHDQNASCKQCVFFFSPLGCNMGDECGFCHQEHAHQHPKRPSKAKRDRYRKLFAARVKLVALQ